MSEQQTPTPIDPADIRPGDTVERRDRITVHALEHGAPPGFYSETAGFFSWSIVEQLRKDVSRTWHLVHRPDPDAEARACAWAEYRKDYAPNPPALSAAHRAFLAGWQAARETRTSVYLVRHPWMDDNEGADQ